MGRPTNPLLSRDMIAATALDLAAEEGAEALTMRAIAKRMGVQGPSLYNHVSSKDDLLDAMTAIIASGVDHSPLAQEGRRAGFTEYARNYRKAFLRHHNVLPAIARRPVQTAEALRGYDRFAGALLGFGLPPAEAAEISAALDYLILGSVLMTYTAGFTRTPEEYRPDYPALAETLEAAELSELDERGFEIGLTLLLDGLELRLSRLG
jgi:AcrR family transcriptional regulator